MANTMVIIISTAILTFALRYLPILLMHDKVIPKKLDEYLRSLPIGILSAIVFQAVFLSEGQLTIGTSNFYLFGFITSLLLAIFTKSLGLIVFSGLFVVGIFNVYL